MKKTDLLNCPQWLLDADTRNEDVTLTEAGIVIWHGGYFRGGSFRGGSFRGGNFLGGNFLGGDFCGGNFRGGNFRGGNFLGGYFWGGAVASMNRSTVIESGAKSNFDLHDLRGLFKDTGCARRSGVDFGWVPPVHARRCRKALGQPRRPKADQGASGGHSRVG